MKIRKNTILNKLNESALKKIIPFHMPGHKRNIQCSMFLRKLGAKYDITEIPGYDNMHNPDGIILNVMQKAEKLWNSKRSFLLINGSTCGIQAAINTLADPKDKIIVARNCHKSVYNMIELQDLKPVFINPVINNELGIYGSIEPETLDKVLTNNPDAKLVIVTSPTYEGVISDIKSLCQVSHNHNVPIVVDEAHGAHLKLNRYFDNSAITAKADIVIQSLHKTLPSLTQTAIAHVCSNNINCENFQRNLSVFQTSSPSYILLSSIEGCIDLLLEKKDIIYTKWIKILDYLDSRLARLKNVKTFYHGLSKNIVYNGVFAYDRAKLVINTDG
ncbi:MAG TPA: aminotransferase class I/II-fold pyridoxal phosphate-dependent enzyme, partial [Clostridia bacterium]|nr:aminotransferase class I/II-fold pyridoxal phosphate-dependent enzyme [Clostridia bacterium]